MISLSSSAAVIMVAVVIIDDRHGLTVEVCRTNQPTVIRVSYHCISRYFSF